MTAGLTTVAAVKRRRTGDNRQRRSSARATLRSREAWAFRLLILPWALGVVLWYAFPMVFSFYVSLTEWDMVSAVRFIGFDNYVQAMHAPEFWQSLKVTTIYSVARTPLLIVLALAVAILLNQRIPGRGFWRTVYFLPSVLNMIAVAMLWLFMFNRDFGLINGILYDWFGIIGPDWLGSKEWVLFSFILMSLWGFGQPMVIFLAALQNVPRELIEAAQIDGAGVWGRFWHVTVPMISPVILFNLIIGIIASFQVFASALVMTGGGPDDASLFYVLYLYREGWQYLHMGYASALAWILFVIIMILTLLVLKTSSRWVHYESKDR